MLCPFSGCGPAGENSHVCTDRQASSVGAKFVISELLCSGVVRGGAPGVTIL